MTRSAITKHGGDHRAPLTNGPLDTGGHDPIPGLTQLVAPRSAVCAEWLNGQGGGATFATTDTYVGGGVDDLSVWTRLIRGTDITDTGDGKSCTCGPGVYIARATMWLAAGFDPATMLFDMRIDPGSPGAGTAGYFGSPHGVAAGFNSGTFVREWAAATAGVAPFEYVAVTEQWFVVGVGDSIDVSTTVHSDTAGLTFVVNLAGATNPGASNLSIVRIGN